MTALRSRYVRIRRRRFAPHRARFTQLSSRPGPLTSVEQAELSRLGRRLAAGPCYPIPLEERQAFERALQGALACTDCQRVAA